MKVPFKKLLFFTGFGFLFSGLVVLFWDIFFWQYGVDYHDVAFFTTNAGFADWPTGERPFYTWYPLYAYSFALWILAALTFALIWGGRHSNLKDKV
jgi:hypothetical protein